MNKDLTEGNPSKLLWRYCLPLFGGVIFQQIYNIADSLIAGRFIGESALAAVGNSYEITLIFIAFATGCNIGASVIVARFFGAKDYGKMKTSVSTTFISAGTLCLALMIIGIVGCDFLLELINTPEETMADSSLYLSIYVWGLPFLFFYNISTGVFSALGDSKTPFYFLACSSLANIGMDILFVTVFEMGVAGVAWATFICQGVSCVLALTVIIRRIAGMKITDEAPLFSWPIFRKIAAVAGPSIIQQSCISIGNIIIQSVINTFGTSVMAGYSAAVKLNNLMTTAMVQVGNGISSYTSQNIGARKIERIRPGLSSGIKIAWVLCLPVTLLYFLCGKWILYLFLDTSATVAISTGVNFLRIVSPFYFFMSAKMVTDGILRGSGMMKKFMVATFTDLVVRVALAELLSKTSLGVTGVWCAFPIGWIVGIVVSLLFYRTGPWMKKAAKAED